MEGIEDADSVGERAVSEHTGTDAVSKRGRYQQVAAWPAVSSPTRRLQSDSQAFPTSAAMLRNGDSFVARTAQPLGYTTEMGGAPAANGRRNTYHRRSRAERNGGCVPTPRRATVLHTRMECKNEGSEGQYSSVRSIRGRVSGSNMGTLDNGKTSRVSM